MKRNSKHTKKIRNLVFVCLLSAILLTVSTYAWFIGMQTVKVNPFEIKIATTEGLMLSLDGENWTTELNTTTETNESEDDDQAYENNTNQWLTQEGEGLIPMSTVGDINTTSSRLRLFEKGSLTTTAGGYRLLTSEVKNTTQLLDDDDQAVAGQYVEGKGYVAFDLFIRNMSGEAYYADHNEANEEAIYLTYDSDVTVGTSGTQNTGIENSVRVAFAQIGRVENQEYSSEDDATYPVSNVTSITCNDDDEKGVTGICRTATIWEPNDKNHIANAINWYGKSCKERTGSASGFTFNTEGACSTVANENAYPTYAISRTIEIADYVDIYDGAQYNKYSTNTVEPTAYAAYHKAKTTGKEADGETNFDVAKYKLVAVDTFTETERDMKGASRPTFMTLAPNSITKVRVYVYIEGQDVDNYDFAQLGKSIQVNFGFTKERYTTDDYTDEPVTVIPGAENTTKIAYAPADGVTVTNPTTTDGKTVVWDAETNAFYHHRNDAVTQFTFTETKGEDTVTATAKLEEGTWQFTGTLAQVSE